MGSVYLFCQTCRLRRLIVCVNFSASFCFCFILHNMYLFFKAFASVGPLRMLERTEQRSERFLM